VDVVDGHPHVAKVRVAGSNPDFRSVGTPCYAGGSVLVVVSWGLVLPIMTMCCPSISSSGVWLVDGVRVGECQGAVVSGWVTGRTVSPAIPAKSFGFTVYRGRSVAIAIAAMSAS
jgi:hypothetical protein